MAERIQQSVTVPADQSGLRLDVVSAALLSAYSRAQLQQWVKAGALTCNGQVARSRDKVCAGDVLQLDAVPVAREDWSAQALPLHVVYEDEALLVINKPVGMVVHPAAGTRDGTLLNALLHHDPALAALPRAGIVHRLDKDTSGLLMVARTLESCTELVRQLQARTVLREYEAIACGVLTGGGTVDASLGRHPRDRVKMAVVAGGKPAVTHYRVVARFARHTHLRLKLETGRTHQIRVHMAHIGHPLLGDSVYGARVLYPPGADADVKTVLSQFRRQALHAASLGVVHPHTGETMQWSIPMPADMQALLMVLRTNAETAGNP